MKRYISAAVCGNIGRGRGNNEDNFYFNGEFLTEATRENPADIEFVCHDKRQFYAVCDGMGGEQLGELASLLAAQTLHKYAGFLKSNPDKNIDEYMDGCITEANKVIFEAQKERGVKRIGTTMAVFAYENSMTCLYNVGDSRTYLLRGGKLRQLSEDDTAVANMVKLNIITPEQAKTHPRRNSLTQYVGIDPEEMVIEAHKSFIKMKNGDIFLLCSDGLSDVLGEADMTSIITENERPLDMAKNLVGEALRREGKDNITAVALKYTCKLW